MHTGCTFKNTTDKIENTVWRHDGKQELAARDFAGQDNPATACQRSSLGSSGGNLRLTTAERS
jgi:hypothetical protein